MAIAFIIMQIGNAELDGVYVDAIVPAIEACGLDPRRVDKHNTGKLLKSEIIEFINDADIVVADLTNERPNCYLEIGYAMGKDKFENLILTVREDHFPSSPTFVKDGPKVHFDLTGYDILPWSKDNLPSFRNDLEKRIRNRLAIIEPTDKATETVWDEGWLENQKIHARAGLEKSGLPGAMEIRFALHRPKPDFDPRKLKSAAGKSTIARSWPIGVFLENNDKYRPNARTDGIMAEIATRDSYDYWAIKRNGDFYTLSSLIEDRNKPDQLFFDRRIEKTTEGLLYCKQLYSNLGVEASHNIQIAMRRSGLKDRYLMSEYPDRYEVFDVYRCIENEEETEISISLHKIKSNLVDHVIKLITSVFTLFDFFELNEDQYSGIIDRFVKHRTRLQRHD